MAKSKYTVDWFIKFFSAIPARKWITGSYNDERGRCCAVGHLQKIGGQEEKAHAAFYDLFAGYSITDVNDGGNPSFRQKTPRARILAALRARKNKTL